VTTPVYNQNKEREDFHFWITGLVRDNFDQCLISDKHTRNVKVYGS